MNHTLVTMWKTLDGTFYSNTANYADYDKAIGNYHNKFLPMQNDTNVQSFRLVLMDEYGNVVEKCGWTRPVQTTAEEVETEA